MQLHRIRGDEEVQYVLVDLPAQQAAELLRPGATLHLQGLDTDGPVLTDGAGQTVCQGCYEEEVGTVMLLRNSSSSASTGEAAGPADASGPQQAGAPSPQLQYQCHTEQRLRMWAPQQARQATPKAATPRVTTPKETTPS